MGQIEKVPVELATELHMLQSKPHLSVSPLALNTHQFSGTGRRISSIVMAENRTNAPTESDYATMQGFAQM